MATAPRWPVAASIVARATGIAGARSFSGTWHAVSWPIRWCLRRLAMVASRTRAALAGVGMRRQMSRNQDAATSSVSHFEQLLVVSPQELSYAVAEPVALVAQLLGNA